MGLDEVHPRVLRELANIVTKPLSMTVEKSWQSGKVPSAWREGSIMLIFKKDRKSHSGNYRPVSLISVPGETMEQIFLDAMLRHKREVIWNKGFDVCMLYVET